MFAKTFALVTLFGIAAASMPHGNHFQKPYKFGYDIKDKHGEQYRHEEGNGGNAVKGSYGFTDARGVKRQVDYVADHGGFRAQVKTNEPGTANQNPAAVQMISNSPYAGGVTLGSEGLGYSAYGLGSADFRNINPRFAATAPGVAGLAIGNLGYAVSAPRTLLSLGYNGVPSLGYARYGY